MMGCDWLNTPEETLLPSADDGPRVSTVDYGESLWFHLVHIHEPNGWLCIIHEQIRRSKTLRGMKNPNPAVKMRTSCAFIHKIKSSLCRRPHCGNQTLRGVPPVSGVLREISLPHEQN